MGRKLRVDTDDNDGVVAVVVAVIPDRGEGFPDAVPMGLTLISGGGAEVADVSIVKLLVIMVNVVCCCC